MRPLPLAYVCMGLTCLNRKLLENCGCFIPPNSDMVRLGAESVLFNTSNRCGGTPLLARHVEVMAAAVESIDDE